MAAKPAMLHYESSNIANSVYVPSKHACKRPYNMQTRGERVNLTLKPGNTLILHMVARRSG